MPALSTAWDDGKAQNPLSSCRHILPIGTPQHPVTVPSPRAGPASPAWQHPSPMGRQGQSVRPAWIRCSRQRPLVSPCVPRRGWSGSVCARQAPPGRRGWATTFTPPQHPVLGQHRRKLLAATARPAHATTASCQLSLRAPQEDSHHPQGPQSSPAAPQPFSVLDMSIRDGRHCQSHGTGACQALQFLLQS